VQAVESYRLRPEGPGFQSRSPRIAQARVRLATDTLSQTPHRAGALYTRYILFFVFNPIVPSLRGSLHKIIHRPNCEIDEKCRIKMALDVVRVIFFIVYFHLFVHAPYYGCVLSIGKRHELPPYKCTNNCSPGSKITKLTG